MNTRMLLVVLECLKDRAFHIKTVYVNPLDSSRDCTSSGSDSSAMGECGGRGIPSFIMVSCAMFTKVCVAHINYLKLLCFLHYPLTV